LMRSPFHGLNQSRHLREQTCQAIAWSRSS
jgi:hypothetical protein